MKEDFCNCIYSIKGGWKMDVETKEMSSLKPRTDYVKAEELASVPMYYGYFPLDIYIPKGYVEVGEVCTGVFAGPRGYKLAGMINEVVKALEGKEYILFKTMKDKCTIAFKVFAKKEGNPSQLKN